MKRIGRVLGYFGRDDWLRRQWTTIGNAVYVPTSRDDDPDWGSRGWQDRWGDVLAHQSVHAHQYQLFGPILMALLYFGPAVVMFLPTALLATIIAIVSGAHWAAEAASSLWVSMIVTSPLTFGFAWGRWYLERQAYLYQLLVKYRDGYAAGTVSASQIRISAQATGQRLWKDYALTWPEHMSTIWFRLQLAKLGIGVAPEETEL